MFLAILSHETGRAFHLHPRGMTDAIASLRVGVELCEFLCCHCLVGRALMLELMEDQ